MAFHKWDRSIVFNSESESRGGSRIPRRRGRQPSGGGHQHMILPNFVKNCMKLRKLWPPPPQIHHLRGLFLCFIVQAMYSFGEKGKFCDGWNFTREVWDLFCPEASTKWYDFLLMILWPLYEVFRKKTRKSCNGLLLELSLLKKTCLREYQSHWLVCAPDKREFK